MASVFLSYAREDAAKAKSLAGILERAGHDVWWDRHIRSGSEYSGAIEEALQRADWVLVLWSKDAVRSSWVRDEAAEGRDSGRLVAAALDDARPPIGFRQYQCTDLSGWSGRGTPKSLGELLSAIAESRSQSAGDDAGVGKAETSKPPRAGQPSRRFGGAGAIAAVLLLAIVAAGALFYVLRGPASSSETPTLVVLPFTDLSPNRDKAYFSEGVAEEILSVLARDPGIRVIGRSSAREFQEGSSDLEEIRKALGVTHVLEGSARTFGDELRMSVRLIDASSGSQVWAEDYQRKTSNIFAVQAEIGRAVAQRLSGSLSRQIRDAGASPTAADTYALYLAARAKMRERTRPALEQALGLAKRVIAADRNYAPGHALYAELLWLLSSDNYGETPVEQIWPIAKRHALHAIKLAPDRPEGYAALGVVPPAESAIAALRKAITLDPSRSELRLWLAGAYGEVGRHSDAFEQHQAAAAMEPIWAPAVRNLANALAANRRFDEAERVVQEFERRGGSASEAALIRSQNGWMAGDLSKAVVQSEAMARARPELLSSSPAYPYLYHDLGFLERAAGLAGSDTRLRLLVSGRYDELAQLVRSEGFWGKPHAFASLDALAVKRDWPTLAALYDQRATPPEQMCLTSAIGPAGAIHFATALKAVGRTGELAPLLKCVKDRIALQSRDRLRSFYYPENYLASLSAQVHAIEGDGAAALREMNRAVELGYWTPRSFGLSFVPALDPWRSTRPYAALDSAIKRKMAAEREQALQQDRGGKLR